MAIKTNTAVRVFELETTRLKTEAEMVGHYTNHGPTIGSFREALLRRFLQGHTPSVLTLEGGFICDSDPGSERVQDFSSRQIDCLVHDASLFAPLLSAEGFSAVYPHAVKAAVEVKSSLTLSRQFDPRSGPASEGFPFVSTARGKTHGKHYRWTGTMIDALENSKTVVDVMTRADCRRSDYFVGVVAFSGKELKSLPSAFKKGEIVHQLGLNRIEQLPDAVCTVDGDLLLFGAWDYEESDVSSGPADPGTSVLNHLPADKAVPGSALQHLTALYAQRLNETVGRQPHRVGGLRSAMGLTVTPANTHFKLNSSGYRV